MLPNFKRPIGLHAPKCRAVTLAVAFIMIAVLACLSRLQKSLDIPERHAVCRAFQATSPREFDPVSDAALLRESLLCTDACTYGKTATSGKSWMPSPRTCSNAWLRLLSSCPSVQWPPPETIPTELKDDFTMGGHVAVTSYYHQQRNSGGKARQAIWRKDDLEAAIVAPTLDAVKRVSFNYNNLTKYYVANVLQKYAASVSQQRGVVWGSASPWAEVLLARAGAAHVTTVEYGSISSEHPRFTAVTPPRLAAMMITNPRSWDFAFTFSSLEHSGLGRYGDALNPWGDMEAAVQTWCLLKPGGIFFLGVPCANSECSKDVLAWNAHRQYGPLRLAEMFEGFELIERATAAEFLPNARGGPGGAIIHVLRKPA